MKKFFIIQKIGKLFLHIDFKLMIYLKNFIIMELLIQKNMDFYILKIFLVLKKYILKIFQTFYQLMIYLTIN